MIFSGSHEVSPWDIRFLAFLQWNQVDLYFVQLMKELNNHWLVDMADQLSNNPQFIISEFMHSGITSHT